MGWNVDPNTNRLTWYPDPTFNVAEGPQDSGQNPNNPDPSMWRIQRPGDAFNYQQQLAQVAKGPGPTTTVGNVGVPLPTGTAGLAMGVGGPHDQGTAALALGPNVPSGQPAPMAAAPLPPRGTAGLALGAPPLGTAGLALGVPAAGTVPDAPARPMGTAGLALGGPNAVTISAANNAQPVGTAGLALGAPPPPAPAGTAGLAMGAPRAPLGTAGLALGTGTQQDVAGRTRSSGYANAYSTAIGQVGGNSLDRYQRRLF